MIRGAPRSGFDLYQTSTGHASGRILSARRVTLTQVNNRQKNAAGDCQRAAALITVAQSKVRREARAQWAPCAVAGLAGCESIQWKYWMYCRISASDRLWFGIGMLLYSFSIALA